MEKVLGRQNILIVDDVSSNIKVIGEALKDMYDIRFARSGKEALSMVDENPPDLILLDIMMPGIDGYEVCRKLRSERDKKDIPIIFITARDDAGDETKGFLMGAVDYITKPFNPDIVRVRVKTHLELKRHRDNLSDLVKERTRQLIHSDRLATLGTIAAAMAHEIKNPLFFISGNVELVQTYIESGNHEKIPEKLSKILEGTDRINRLIENLKGYSQKKQSHRLICRVATIVTDAVDLIGYRLKRNSVTVDMADIPQDMKIQCDVQQMSQVLVNLMTNALDVLEEHGGNITISACQEDGMTVIRVRDSGPGIQFVNKDSIFDPFVTSKSESQGTGLGLFIAKNLVEEHDGRIDLTSNDANGAEFSIYLPTPPK